MVLTPSLSLLPTISSARAAENEAVPPQVEAAVDKALKWLADSQQKDGQFPTSIGPSTAITSLCVMAFLSRGHTPGQGPYGDMLYKSIEWVAAQQKETGMLSASQGTMYDHGISTVMLCEVYGMVDDPHREKLDKVIAKAVKLILDAQKVNKAPPHVGGWRYSPASGDSDISCTGWQLMALRGAANCGANVPKAAIDAGVGYIRGNAVPVGGGGGFAYQGAAGPNQARTGTGITALALLGQRGADGALPPEAIAGGKFLLLHPLDNRAAEFYFYAVYYCAQAANQLGGEYWDKFYPSLRDTLLACQQAKGAFVAASSDAGHGETYTTAMATLALCVPYRYLPLYQK
jgi:hypothetical protein